MKRSWTKEEHFLFLQGLQEYGKGQWQCIANKIGTKTASQVRSHCKKYLMRQQKDQQSKKMKTIHDMTMESPEMQQLAMKQQNEMTQDDANVLYREKSFVPLHTKFGKDNATSDRSLGNQLGSETDGNSEWYNDEPQDNQYASITKIPYFIRERRIRRLEYCLQQMKQSMNWMWSNITKWDSFDRSN